MTSTRSNALGRDVAAPPSSVPAMGRRPITLLLVFLLVVMAAPLLAPLDPDLYQTVSQEKFQPPSFEHPMGTNSTNRDVFRLVLKGAQISLTIGLGAMAIALALGTVYGALAAALGGWTESLLMRTADVTLSVPRFLILLAVAAISEHPLTTLQLIVLIGCTGWFGIARLTHGEVQAILKRDWLLAAQATGVGAARIGSRHIFPHLLPMLIVVATVGIGHTIVLEAALAFLGAGSSGASLGYMLHSGSSILTSTWWLSVFPGLAIVLIVFACNALGEALRGVFSPEQVPTWPTT